MDLAAIRAKVKTLIGDSGYDNTALDIIVNRHYQRYLPLEFKLDALDSTYTTTTSEGIGTIAIDPNTYLQMTGPAYRDGERVTFWTDGTRFRDAYPDERAHLITGVSIANSQFTIAGDYHSKFGTAHTFIISGSTGNNGMWTVSACTHASNVTTITVAETITDATVDGSITYQENDTPVDILYENQSLIWRPFPDTNYGANYQLSCATILVPTALTVVTHTPTEKSWGMVLAVSTAIEILMHTSRKEEADGLLGMREYFAGLVHNKEIAQFTNHRGTPSF